MILTINEINDFTKKAAFIANKSTCGYKIGCVGVVEVKKNFEIPKQPLKSEQNPYANKIIRKEKSTDLLYIKTWNQTLPGEIYCQSCDQNGNKICIRQEQNLKGKDPDKVCSIHAEANLIATCARYQIPTNDMTVFITNTPCYICAKSIYVSGINNLYYISKHTDERGLDFLIKNGIHTEQVSM